jgi:hypothetical protein
VLDPAHRIEFNLRFVKPWESEAKAYFEISKTEHSDGSIVEWGFDGDSPWPWNISLLFMDLDSELGKDLDKGLKKLRKLQEAEEF